ncbi:MAG: hypothetical protein ACI8ZM_003555 [Crocinitomix sp.]|jgi:hypothetical protein
MIPKLDLIKRIVTHGECQFKDEILKELENFIQIGCVNSHKISETSRFQKN